MKTSKLALMTHFKQGKLSKRELENEIKYTK